MVGRHAAQCQNKCIIHQRTTLCAVLAGATTLLYALPVTLLYATAALTLVEVGVYAARRHSAARGVAEGGTTTEKVPATWPWQTWLGGWRMTQRIQW